MELRFCAVCEKNKKACQFATGICKACYKRKKQRATGVKERPKWTKEGRVNYHKRYYRNNKSIICDRVSKWKEKNYDKVLKAAKEYRKNSKEVMRPKRRELSAKRRARKQSATIGKFRKELIDFYQKCPEGMHVDHIIPIAGKEVCGLHVPWNLQYLSPEENRKKSNKVLPQ